MASTMILTRAIALPRCECCCRAIGHRARGAGERQCVAARGDVEKTHMLARGRRHEVK
jgi:hypothetical protein